MASSSAASLGDWHCRFVACAVVELIYDHGAQCLEAGASNHEMPWGLGLAGLSSLQLRLLRKALRSETIAAYLGGAHGVELVVLRTPTLMLFAQDLADSGAAPSSCAVLASMPSEPLPILTHNRLGEVMKNIHKTFENPQPLHYGKLIEVCVDACCRAVTDLLPEVFTKDVLDDFVKRSEKFYQEYLTTPEPEETSEQQVRKAPFLVCIVPNCPIGGDMMNFDFCFETAGSHRRISYPDYNLLSDDHHAYWFKQEDTSEGSSRSRRLLRKHYEYIMEAITVPAHEIIHVFQSTALQKDSSHSKWSCEHDASFAAASLAHYLSEHDQEMKHVLGGGAWEAAVLSYFEHERMWLCGMSADDIQAYQDIALNFAVDVDPRLRGNEARCLESGTKESLFKGVIAYENLYDEVEALRLQLQCIFKDRLHCDTFHTPPLAEFVAELHSRYCPAAWVRRQQCTMQELAAFVSEMR